MTRSFKGRALCQGLRGFVLAGSVLLSTAPLAEVGVDGNRYYLPRYYQGEISAAQTFWEAVVKKVGWFNRSDRLVILDVRDATEYKRGHPPLAYHFPYPRIYRDCINDARSEDGGSCTEGTVNPPIEQDPEDLFLMVEETFPDKSQRFVTVCRTGYRSVLAANVLSKPEKFICDAKHPVGSRAHAQCVVAYTGRGYNSVLNMWPGFVGLPKAGIEKRNGVRYVIGDPQDLADIPLDDRPPAKGFVAYDLDLDNDNDITAADKDGWRYRKEPVPLMRTAIALTQDMAFLALPQNVWPSRPLGDACYGILASESNTFPRSGGRRE